MSITIGKRLIDHDGTCWSIAEKTRSRKGRGKRKEETRLINPHYYAQLKHVADRLVEMECVDAIKVSSTLDELVVKVQTKLCELLEIKQ